MRYMRYLKFYETFTNKVTIGIDIDGTINNFGDAYNLLYSKYFPDKEVFPVTDWYWYKKMDYEGKDARKWFEEKKAEIFETSQPYPDAIVTINNIYDFVKSYGFTLNIVTNQPTKESQDSAKKWIEKYGVKYDDIIFVDSGKDKWKHVDIMVDDSDKVINSKPLSKVCIKIDQLWNTDSQGDINLPNIKGLTIDVVKQAISMLKNKTTL